MKLLRENRVPNWKTALLVGVLAGNLLTIGIQQAATHKVIERLFGKEEDVAHIEGERDECRAVRDKLLETLLDKKTDALKNDPLSLTKPVNDK